MQYSILLDWSSQRIAAGYPVGQSSSRSRLFDHSNLVATLLDDLTRFEISNRMTWSKEDTRFIIRLHPIETSWFPTFSLSPIPLSLSPFLFPKWSSLLPFFSPSRSFSLLNFKYKLSLPLLPEISTSIHQGSYPLLREIRFQILWTEDVVQRGISVNFLVERELFKSFQMKIILISSLERMTKDRELRFGFQRFHRHAVMLFEGCAIPFSNLFAAFFAFSHSLF